MRTNGQLTTVILIRHAEPIIAKDAPPNTWILSEAGRKAAAGIASSIASFGLREIVTSPEAKAVQTAEIIADLVGAQICIDPRLREHERKAIGFLARDDFEAGIASIFGKPDETAFGDESADAVHARFCAGINDAVSRSPNVIAAVTHGTAMAIYASRLGGMAATPFWTQLAMPDVILIEGGVVRRINPSEEGAEGGKWTRLS